MSVVDELAAELEGAERSGNPIAPLSGRVPGLTLDVAYAVQRERTRRRLEGGERLVGRKVGLTSVAMQQLLGVDEPDFGALFADMVVASGATVDLRTLLQPRVEAEIAFLLDRDLAGADVGEAQVLAATASVVAAIEVIDSRIQDWQIGLLDTVADNASSALVVLGDERRSPAGLDLPAIEVVVHRNGAPVEKGVGAAALGHPASCVAWLVRTLSTYGEGLHAGDVVMPGALHAAVTVAPGDVIRADFNDLGSVEVAFGEDPS